jgi:molybdopterin adenylyltransferase
VNGRITAICLSERTGTVKAPVDRAVIRAGHGLEGDAHAGPGHRQLSALAAESIARMRAQIPDLADGAFAENFVTDGIDWNALAIGRRLAIGDSAVVQITQRGKECHTRCAIYATTGDCIMPTEGMFMVARHGGDVRIGDAIRTAPELDRIRYAVITVSDRGAAGEREDASGPVACELLEAELGAHRVDYCVVPDERDTIAATLRSLCDDHVVDVILTSGGTGLAPRDVTPEATLDVADREVPGIAEAIRAAGLAKTPHAMLSRAVCAQRGATLIVNLSGSPRAVQEQVETLLPALPHAVAVTSGVPQDCARP